MDAFTKVVRIGKLSGYMGPHSLFCKIVFARGELSITGVEGPTRDGNCVGGCGQIIMHDWGIAEYAPGWSAETAAYFRALWNEWHLNHMCAGSPAQEAFLRANPVKAVYPESHYEKECEALAAAGLNPDLVDGKPYKYGSALLKKTVPDHVLAFLSNLPDTDIKPNWV